MHIHTCRRDVKGKGEGRLRALGKGLVGREESKQTIEPGECTKELLLVYLGEADCVRSIIEGPKCALSFQIRSITSIASSPAWSL